MAKRKNKIVDIEVKDAKVISVDHTETGGTIEKTKPLKPKREAKTEHILKVDYGCNPDGTPRHPKGSPIKLTEAELIKFKNQKYI